MARITTLDNFSEPAKTPVKTEPKSQAMPAKTAVVEAALVVRQKREPRAFPPIAPQNLPPSYFVSASYDGRQKKL